MSSSPHHPMLEQENKSIVNKLVESTMASLNEHATLVASSFEPFYSVVLPLWVIGVASLADCKVRIFKRRDDFN
jgi:hypothetical protein